MNTPKPWRLAKLLNTPTRQARIVRKAPGLLNLGQYQPRKTDGWEAPK